MKAKKPKRPLTRDDIMNPGMGLSSVTSNDVLEMIRESVFPREKMIVDRLDKIEHMLGMAGTEPEHDCFMNFAQMRADAAVRGTIERRKQQSPDLPLNARVAKALGKECSYITYQGKLGWYYRVPYVKAIRDWYSLIPDYDKHIDLAMGALEEYCKQNKWYFRLTWPDDSSTIYICEIRRYNTIDSFVVVSKGEASTAAQAICEAIVADAEQSK